MEKVFGYKTIKVSIYFTDGKADMTFFDGTFGKMIGSWREKDGNLETWNAERGEKVIMADFVKGYKICREVFEDNMQELWFAHEMKALEAREENKEAEGV